MNDGSKKERFVGRTIPTILAAFALALSGVLTVDFFVAHHREQASSHAIASTISSVRAVDDLSAALGDFDDSVRAAAPKGDPKTAAVLLSARDRVVEAMADFEQYVAPESRAPWRELRQRLLALEETLHLDPGSEPSPPAVLTQRSAALHLDLRAARDVVERRGTDALEAIARQHTAEGILEALVLALSALASVILFVAWTRQEARARKRDEQVEAQLRRAIEDLDGFAARVAHDLRGPLLPLLAESTWLERAPVPDNIRSHGERIARSVRRLSGMIDALLRFARAGVVPSERVRTPVNATVADVVDELEETARARGARIETQLGPEAEVECEANLFKSLVANLIENALKYGAKEGASPHITVRTQVRDSSSTLEVEDRGPGIPQQLRQRVFEPMFRGHLDGRGVGLGLAIVKRLVDAHGGRIEVLPGAEGGALFRIVLPLAQERPSPEPRAPAPPPAAPVQGEPRHA